MTSDTTAGGEYAELYALSNYTFLQGASHPEELVARARGLGYGALALTDECSLAGVVRAHGEAKAVGLKLLIGACFTLADGSRLILLARNREGYGALSAVITRGRRRSAKGEYYLERGDFVAGLEHCLAILVPGLQGDREPAEWLAAHFGGRGWIGVEQVRDGRDGRRLANARCQATTAGLPLVACGGVLMHDAGRRPLLDCLAAIREGVAIGEAGAVVQHNGERCLRGRDHLARLFPGEALAETLRIAERCDFSLDELRYQYPDELVPPGLTPALHLRRLTEAGARGRWPGGMPAKVRGLVEHELALIAELRYEPYFLTVHDIVRFARARGILCQGRGSAANSAVCYCLGITEVDPARMEMLFERFISRERGEPPDIDVDFEHQRREEVIQYIYGKYGRERAALAATVISYRPKGALRDLARVFGMDGDQSDRLIAALHGWDGERIAPEALREQGFDPANRTLRMLFALMRQLLGFPRHLSQHVGGFVISRGPLSELVPVENAAMPGRTVIQWDKNDLEALGLLKVDCLALGMLSAIRRAFEMLNDYHGWGRERQTRACAVGGAPIHGAIQEEGGYWPGVGGAQVLDFASCGRGVGGEGSPECKTTTSGSPQAPSPQTPLPRGEGLLQRGLQDISTSKPINTQHSAPSTPDPALGPQHSAPSTPDSALGPQHSAPSTPDSALGTQHSAPSTKIGLHNIPPEDPETYGMIQRGETIGVFQIESRAQMAMLPRLKPACFYDLVIEVAIVRPGPILGDMVHPYLLRRQGKEAVEYPSDEVREVLGRTLGVPIFQEQVIKVAMVAAGFSPGEADQLRRSIAAWRKRGTLERFEQRLVDGMRERGYEEAFAQRIYRQILGFGEYGFPESHAASFALLVYVSAWLKCHHPAAFFGALLNSQPMGFYAPAQLIGEARRQGVEVRPVDVEHSDWECTLEPSSRSGASHARPQPALRLGLCMVRGLSEKGGRGLVAARAGGAFRSLVDLHRRAALNGSDRQALAAADALRGVAGNRRQAAWHISGLAPPLPLVHDEPERTTPLLQPPSAGEQVVADYAATGLSLASHPLALIRPQLDRKGVSPAWRVAEKAHGDQLFTAGIVINRQRPGAAKNVTFVTLEDEFGHINLVIWQRVAERYRQILLGARLLAVAGEVQREGEVIHVVARRLVDFSEMLGGLVARSRDFH
jgi:DNA polymerase III alpha subunit